MLNSSPYQKCPCCAGSNWGSVLLPVFRQELVLELEQDQREQQTSSRLIQEHSKLLEDNSTLSTHCQGLKSKLSLIKSQNQHHS